MMADRRRRKSLLNKSSNTKISPPKSVQESQNCIICFDKVSCRGNLSVCDHWFCFPCIFEWSKNTNTCPVCKAKFRCISKTHLVPGKSPIQKVRVPDVDQRVHQDDEDFIWAEIESLSENEVSDYEPSSNDDIHDESFEISLNMVLDTDDSSTDMEEMSEASSWDSDTNKSISYDSDEMSSTNYKLGEDWSPSVIKKKKSSRVVISDGETSEGSVDGGDGKPQDECQPSDRNRKSTGKATARGGFHRHNRPKPRRLSSERFEAELKRLRSKTKDQKKKTTSKMNTSNKQKNKTTRERTRESANNIGRWLNVASTGSQPSTSARSSNTRKLTRQRRTGTTATTSSRSRFRNVKTSVKVQVSYESKRNESESRQVQPILPKTRSHKRLTRKFASESESSSGESWTALVKPSKKANVSERVRHTTTTRRTLTKRPSRILQELQNFVDDRES